MLVNNAWIMYVCFSSYADKEQLGVDSKHPQLCICTMLYVNIL